MRRKLTAALAAFTLAGAAGGASVPPVVTPDVALAKPCSAGYKHAVINGSHKCLRRGQYCARAYDRKAPRQWPYIHYGYRCIKRDANGDYHLTLS